MLTKQEILLGRCAWVESSRVREPRTALPALAFMVMGLVSGLSLANHSDSESFLVVPCSAKMDAREKDSGRWSDRWCLFDLSQTLLVGGGLLVPCSLPGPPVVKLLGEAY